MSLCHGYTINNIPCQKTVKYGNYCSCHTTQSFYYEIDRTWPHIKSTQEYVIKVHNIQEIMNMIHYIKQKVSASHIQNNIFYCNRLIIISCMELILKNQDVCYGSLRLENIIKTIISIMSPFRDLELYITNFSLTFEQIYQKKYNARKKYIEFILVNAFGLDIAEHILKFY